MNISQMFFEDKAPTITPASTGLIQLDWQAQSVGITEEARKLKDRALELSRNVSWVLDAASQERAVEAQQALAGVIVLVEKSRKAAKEPALEFGRKIDDAAKALVAEAKQEQLRIGVLVGNFQALEQEKARRAQQAENERLSALEREKAAELAKATTHEELDAIQEQFNQRAKDEAIAPVVPERAEGQRVTQDWEVTVSDIHTLYRHHPNCVKLEPLMSEIKGLLKAGATVKGVIAKPIIKAGVIRTRQATAIDV